MGISDPSTLQVAARDVAVLPLDDPRLVHLANLTPEVIEHYTAEENRLIGRHGFGHGATQTAADLLAVLVTASWGEADATKLIAEDD